MEGEVLSAANMRRVREAETSKHARKGLTRCAANTSRV